MTFRVVSSTPPPDFEEVPIGPEPVAGREYEFVATGARYTVTAVAEHHKGLFLLQRMAVYTGEGGKVFVCPLADFAMRFREVPRPPEPVVSVDYREKGNPH